MKPFHIAKPDVVLQSTIRSRRFCLCDDNGVWAQQLDEAMVGGDQNRVVGTNTPQQVIENPAYPLCPVTQELGADLVVECRQISSELVALVRDRINEDVHLPRISISESHHHTRPGGVGLGHEAQPGLYFLLRQPQVASHQQGEGERPSRSSIRCKVRRTCKAARHSRARGDSVSTGSIITG